VSWSKLKLGKVLEGKKQTHHNPIFSQVIKSRMAIRLVFHWGPDVDIDRSSGEFDEMFRGLSILMNVVGIPMKSHTKVSHVSVDFVLKMDTQCFTSYV